MRARVAVRFVADDGVDATEFFVRGGVIAGGGTDRGCHCPTKPHVPVTSTRSDTRPSSFLAESRHTHGLSRIDVDVNTESLTCYRVWS